MTLKFSFAEVDLGSGFECEQKVTEEGTLCRAAAMWRREVPPVSRGRREVRYLCDTHKKIIAGEYDVEVAQKFWMVFSPQGGSPSKMHAEKPIAEAEATRLAKENIGIVFYLLETVRGFKASRPTVHNVTIDDGQLSSSRKEGD